MNDQIIQRILNGTASREEKESFYAKLKDDPAEQAEFVRLRRLWDLNLIRHTRVDASRARQMFEDFWQAVGQQKKRPARMLRLLSYAAAVICAMVAGGALYALLSGPAQISHRRFSSGQGSISSLVLEDGSGIWLNSGSVIDLEEGKNEVTVRLRGEAYFEVTHNESRTFVVDLGTIQVQDLGTIFNISAYPGEEFFRATLLEGKISVLDDQGELIRTLDRNETFRYSPDNRSFAVEQLDPELVTGWTQNKFVFIGKPLDEICREIEKWYGVTVSVRDPELKEGKYTSVIRRTTTVRQMMDMFRLTTGIHYQIRETADGKQIIELSK